MGKRVRVFDVGRVVDEFEMLSTMGFNQINLVDDLFTARKNRCMAICDTIVERGISHPWTAFARVNTVSQELLEKMKEARCTTLCFGIESGNQEILDTVKKKTTIKQIRNAIDICEKVGIEAMSAYILGLPGESRETAEKSYAFARELNLNFGFHILAPFPGTEVRDKREEFGIRILTNDWDKYDANQAVCETEHLSGEEIDQISQEMNSEWDEKVESIFGKYKRDEPMSKEDGDFIESHNRFVFARDLILMELVETYPGLKNGADRNEIINDFALFIEKKTEFSKDNIHNRITKLFSQNCIKIDTVKGETGIKWVAPVSTA